METKGQLTATADDWRQKIAELQALLEEIRPRLVSAETELADRLAQINAFEFRLRSVLDPLTRRLEKVESEIRELRRQLRQLQEEWFLDGELQEEDNWTENGRWHFGKDEGAAASGQYRYRQTAVSPPPRSLNADESATLKRLYRRLARRFHPDFALDDEDRAHRTKLMMAINAAYAAADLQKLRELAERPNQVRQPTYTDQELAAALLNELAHCQRRLKEIDLELAQLENHDSVRLMNRVESAKRKGRDLLQEIAGNIRRKTMYRMAQRDALQAEIDAFDDGQAEWSSDTLADTVYELGLDQSLAEDPMAAFTEWRDRHYGRLHLDDEEEL